ncbi:acyltransferase family protein [Geodermatophilus sp. SYSU D00684]
MRAVAAFMVFLVHIRGLRPLGVQPPETSAFALGAAAVSFFFVLSGAVLSWTWRPEDPVRAQLRRRAARILPNHLVTWVVAGVLTVVSIGMIGGRPRAEAAAFVLGIPLLQSWVPGLQRINGPAWSLSCEAFFYLLLPFLVPRLYALSVARRWAVATGAVIATVTIPLAVTLSPLDPALHVWAVVYLPLARLPEFVLGCVLGLQLRDGVRLRFPFPVACGVGAAATVLAGPAGQGLFTHALVVVPFALILLAAAERDLRGARSILARPVSVRLGEWSFAFYLVHDPVIWTLTLITVPGDVPSAGLGLVLAGTALVLSVLAAWALHTLVERPAERRWRVRRPRSADRAAVPGVASRITRRAAP